MKSMTGYGTSRITNKALNLEISIKSVNGRFLDARVHLPREYAPFEIEVKKQLSQVFHRGTVDVYINRKLVDRSAQMEVLVQKNVAKKWLKAYRELGKELKIPGDLSLSDLASLPEVIQVSENQSLLPTERKLMFQLLNKVIQSCDTERDREGKALGVELLSLTRQLQALLKKMAAKAKSQGDYLRKRLEQRLAQAELEEKVDPQRIAQEIAIQLDRSDVSEELSRLSEHLSYFEKLIKESETQGKKLDFYTQELLREVNTIGSKSQVAELTEMVVHAKGLVEKIREQVQNVE